MKPEAYVSGLARTLMLGPGRLWAMLSAYFDESGTHDDSKVFVVAGLIAPVEKWERLSESWTKTLRREGLEHFHMVDCCHGVGLFEGWDAIRRRQLFEKLVRLIVRDVPFRTWTAIAMDDYFSLYPESDRKKAAERLYTICAPACASRIRYLLDGREDVDVIPYVFEQGGRGGPRAAGMFRTLIDSGASLIYGMGALAVDDRRRMPPLQAADIHAYEVYKYFSDQLQRTGRPTRKSFQALMSIKEAGNGGHLFNRERLNKFFDRLERLEEGENALDIPVDPLNNERAVTITPRSSGES